MGDRPRARFLTGAESAVLPVLLAAGGVAWLLRPEAFIGDDGYFYLVIARNLALHGEQTFSGIFATNGFHPLWGYGLAGYSRLVAWVDPDLLWNVRTAIPLAVCVLIVAGWNLRCSAIRLGVWPPLFVGVPLLLVVMNRVLFSEAALYLLTLSVLVRLSTGDRLQRRFGPELAGVVCGLTFLARLDSIFLLAAWSGWYAVRAGSIRKCVRTAAVALLIVAPYLLSNVIWFGGMMPISSWRR